MWRCVSNSGIDVVESNLDSVAFTLLDRAIHHFEELGFVALDGATTGTQHDERRLFTCQNRISTAIDANHKVLNGRRAQADEAGVFWHHCWVPRALIRQIQHKTVILDLVVKLVHLVEEVALFLLLLSRRRVLKCRLFVSSEQLGRIAG